MNKRFFLILIFFIIFNNWGYVFEHAHFEHILNYLEPHDYHPKTLIILDIDNTLAHPKQLFGGDQWLMHQIESHIKNGLTASDALTKTLPFYFQLQDIVELIPVEQTTPAYIKSMQEKGILIIALTARSDEIKDRTLQQLAAMGIDFSNSSFMLEPFEETVPCKYSYKNGIIFCHGNDKGKVLKLVLEKVNHKPIKVIMMDDKEKISPCSKKYIR